MFATEGQNHDLHSVPFRNATFSSLFLKFWYYLNELVVYCCFTRTKPRAGFDFVTTAERAYVISEGL